MARPFKARNELLDWQDVKLVVKMWENKKFVLIIRFHLDSQR